MALTKQRKAELLAEYSDMLKRSQAQVVMTYSGLSVKGFDTLRAKLREVGGEFHVVKNTLAEKAFEEAGVTIDKTHFEKSSAVAFAFEDAPAVAKALAEYVKTSEFLKIKGGYLDKRPMNAEGVKALADLPPLPVMRARLLGMINAPASKLVRTLAEPARGLAAVIQAHAEPAAAAN